MCVCTGVCVEAGGTVRVSTGACGGRARGTVCVHGCVRRLQTGPPYPRGGDPSGTLRTSRCTGGA